MESTITVMLPADLTRELETQRISREQLESFLIWTQSFSERTLRLCSGQGLRSRGEETFRSRCAPVSPSPSLPIPLSPCRQAPIPPSPTPTAP